MSRQLLVNCLRHFVFVVASFLWCVFLYLVHFNICSISITEKTELSFDFINHTVSPPSRSKYKLASPRKYVYLAIFFQYNRRVLRQKAGGACLYMSHNGYWPASFEVIPPPKVGSSAAKKRKFKFREEILICWYFKTSLRFQAKPEYFLTRFPRRKFCHSGFDSREQQAILPD